MAERHRSKDGRSETRELLGEELDAPSAAGRSGGALARKTGTKDELRHMTNASAGATRVTKSDEDRPGTDNLGERNK
ncbi:hypothetical protein KUL25_04805 [Rhodobacteraceae bacterium N5(2021)]|uniref:Uncharacterized protein n=1 Tax=Gymnodinialimonas phycosphaerae TaxID=2841589 RepID=A0A975TX50_9RHOB|nr:hypothetical protein [Gymnodinialimonas phycosphaerae]MBY4892079.1 hypothetical protein [Gymnodinialimonas phycosphaerae]